MSDAAGFFVLFIGAVSYILLLADLYAHLAPDFGHYILPVLDAHEADRLARLDAEEDE